MSKLKEFLLKIKPNENFEEPFRVRTATSLDFNNDDLYVRIEPKTGYSLFSMSYDERGKEIKNEKMKFAIFRLEKKDANA